MAQTDASELVRRAQAGDLDAYGELVDRFRDAAFGLCYHRCDDFEDARDLAQEAFIRAYQHLGELADPARFAAWLRRIAERVCIDWRRRQRDERPLEEAAARSSPPLDDLAALRVTVQRALSSLPEAQRLAVTLYHINGYTYREIAEFLAAPETTVKARLDAARASLRGALADVFREALQAQRPLERFREEVIMRVTHVEMKQAVDQSHGGPQPVLLLGDEERAVPIWIGDFEATNIRAALDKWEAPRPMTYDLMLNTWAAFGIRLTGVRIADLRENVYFAELELTRRKTVKQIDCRTSDAVNLALRADVPVEVDDSVVEKLGVSAEQARLDYGNLPDYQIEQPDRPPLHQAAADGNIEAVERLLDEGEEPDMPNKQGATPLRVATMRGQAEVAKLLIARGADANARDNEGRSHLHVASHFGHRDVVEALLAAGADAAAEDDDRATPLSVTRSPEIAKLLREHGAAG
jgi:RNA polymerase sigma-70 factor (ECF subfamily)